MLHTALLLLATLGLADEGVEYAKDVAPIFEARCIKCHGVKKQKAGLRLDTSARALAGSDYGENPVVVAGDPEESTLYELVSTADEEERMPPTGSPLDVDQIEVLRRWIKQGAPGSVLKEVEAEGKEHWAYVPPLRSTPPQVDDDWARTDLDQFVLARMKAEGLAPMPEADPATLLRRLSLDLTGLPPSASELDAFLNDESEGAYEQALERLLDSPAYGERMARGWLDLARYADTNGYEKDQRRSVWPWRDWVIDAYNTDMPFDQFTIEQLAGDLLEQPTQAQRVATGFHRNTMINAEGGVDPEEYRVATVVDRVNTTGAVWMGTTFGCAQCHTHKFDPLSHREYYRLFAYFNSTTDIGPSDRPRIDAPTPVQAVELAERQLETDQLDALFIGWSDERERELEALTSTSRGWQTLPPLSVESDTEATFLIRADDSILVAGEAQDKDLYLIKLELEAGVLQQLRLEVLLDEALKAMGPGRSGQGNFVLNEIRALITRPGSEPKTIKFSAARADFFQDSDNKPWRPEHTLDGNLESGWAIGGQTDSAHQLLLTLAESFEVNLGDVLEIELDQQYGSGHVIGSLRISASARPADTHLPLRPDVESWLARREYLNGDEREALHAWFFANTESLELERKRLAELNALPGAPTTLVMQELDEPRITHLLDRGSFLAPAEVVETGVPAVMGAIDANAPRNRLGLAQWLVDGSHPLTARVAANRLWAQVFGRGLVTTEGDFGTQGALPTHPALLDWLACEFIDAGWSTKSLLRTLMTSATYRQSSKVTPASKLADPDNRWLARGARYRVEAEMVRDITLATADLLDRTIGGPSVFPSQPEGIWNMTYSGDQWKSASDHNRFRRGLYTFWRRTAPYPAFMAFDATSREVSCTRRDRSNTPLQALALLNDPAFVEAAVGLGARMLRTQGGGERQVAALGFRLCTSRFATEAEIDVLVGLYQSEFTRFTADPEAASALLDVPLQVHLGELPPAQLAAWSVVANVLLNLDETITRN